MKIIETYKVLQFPASNGSFTQIKKCCKLCSSCHYLPIEATPLNLFVHGNPVIYTHRCGTNKICVYLNNYYDHILAMYIRIFKSNSKNIDERDIIKHLFQSCRDKKKYHFKF